MPLDDSEQHKKSARVAWPTRTLNDGFNQTPQQLKQEQQSEAKVKEAEKKAK